MLVRRTRAQQRIYAELLADLGEQQPELPSPPDPNDADMTAAFARELLGVSLDQQRAWRDDSTALRGWTRAVEELGVLVLHTSTVRGQTISTDEMLGLSEAEPLPAIVLNGRDHARRRIFTLLHEFAHLLLRREGVCDLHDRLTTPNYDPVEVFCNAVSAATLMPREPFLRDQDVRGGERSTEWDNETLGAIARRFTTSREAVLRRLLTLDLTSDAYYRSWRDEYNRQFELAGDADVEEEEARRGFANYYTMKVRELGLPYMATVLQAYSTDAMNASDLARFLNIKLKNLPRVEQEVVKALARSDE